MDGPTQTLFDAAPDMTIEIEPELEARARSYIEAIVTRGAPGRGPLAGTLGADAAAVAAARLWECFEDRFAALVTGPYARPPQEALLIALGAI
jgi:hypothetical protein